jgi:hypothetical protein
MIRREEDGTFYLIRQDDHAKLSGELAARVGRDAFQPASAGEPALATHVLTAVAMHDAGWPLHDDAPSLNPRLIPTDVFESRPEAAMSVWTASADRAQAVGPYEGLLVSLHGLALSAIGLDEVMRHFARKNVAYTRERFELNRFQHNEIDRQIALRTQLGLSTDGPLDHGLAALGTSAREDLLTFHFRLLQAMDKLALALCCSQTPFEAMDLSPRPGERAVKVRLMRAGRVVRVDPWVFDRDRLEVSIACKALPAQPFANVEAFQSAYAAAPEQRLTFAIEP